MKTRYMVHGKRSFYGFCEERPVCVAHEVGTWCCTECSDHRCPICAIECESCGANVKDKLAS